MSQYLLQKVIYDQEREAIDTILRILLFKLFNRVETWEYLISRVGEPDVKSFNPEAYACVLDERFKRDERLYSAAYVMPTPSLGHIRKHRNHLALLDELLKDGTLAKLTKAVSLEKLYHEFLRIRSFGPFLAFQYAVDLNYSPHFDFSEMDFVVAGPGALRGISKCFKDTGGLTSKEVIFGMASSAEQFFAKQEKPFQNLSGRPLQLVDCQNLFCEVDKYARVRHPEHSQGGPIRIKQNFKPNCQPMPLGYPPKWGLKWNATKPTVIGRSNSHRALN